MSDAPKTQTQQGGYEGRIGRYSGSLADELIAACGLRPGDRVLDVGCGTGALTERLAAGLGSANVVGVDPGREDLAICATRCPGVELSVGEAEDLPFDDSAFDAALAQLVVGHMRDAERGVAEMARVVRPGGLVAACVWDFAEGMTVLRAFWDSAAELDAAGAARYDQAATHAYSSREELDTLWRGAGLSQVQTGALRSTTDYEDFEDLWRPMTITDGAPGRFLATVGADTVAAVRERLWERLGRPGGPFELDARAWYVTGRVA